MGKIFDALEKSSKKRKASISAPKDLRVVAKDEVVKVEPPKKERVLSGNDQVYDKVDKNLITLTDPQSFEAEQFKILRTNLLFPVSGKPPRSILVTSAVPGEGKSFVSSNLAISIALNINEHVLLIDCDIRKPIIHSYFGFGNVPGLAEYLSKGVPLSSLLMKTNLKKLSILGGGNPPHNPAELLSSEEMSNLLEEVKARYGDRYIIIDSPPPQMASETSAIARQVDGILLVVKYGSTRREYIENTVEMVGKEKILGVVFNWFDTRSPTYSYKYGKYGDYYKQYKSASP